MTTTKKITKLDQALEIFNRHTSNRASLSKKEFRAVVVADFKKELGLTNPGTIGMYFGQADQLVTNRTPKQYNRTAPRRTTKAVTARKNAAISDGELNRLASSFANGVANIRKAAKKSTTTVSVEGNAQADNTPTNDTTTSITGKTASSKKPAVRAL